MWFCEESAQAGARGRRACAVPEDGDALGTRRRGGAVLMTSAGVARTPRRLQEKGGLGEASCRGCGPEARAIGAGARSPAGMSEGEDKQEVPGAEEVMRA